MTSTAVKNRKYRLTLGLLLIAFHAISEQRFLHVDYNVFLAAPFSIFSMNYLPNKKTTCIGSKKNFHKEELLATVFTATFVGLPVLLFWQTMLSWFRTIYTVIRVSEAKQQLMQRLILLVVTLAVIAVFAFVVWLLYSVIWNLLSRRKPGWWKIAFLFCMALLFVVAFVHGEARLDRAANEYVNVIMEDASVIQAAESIKGLKLYITDLPTLYDRVYGKHDVTLYSGDDYARLENIALIGDSSWNSGILFNAGFSYAEISDEHAVYTDSQELINMLTSMGYSPGVFCSKKVEIPLVALAEQNGLSFTDDDTLLLTGDNYISHVSDIDLQRGTYLFRFDLNLLEPGMVSAGASEEPVFLFRFTDYSGMRMLWEQSVPYSQFDEAGHLLFEAAFNFNAPSVEFNIIPQNGTVLELLSVSYQGIG